MLAKLRSSVYDGKPWYILPSVMASMESALEAGDVEAIEMAMGGEKPEAPSANGIAVIHVAGVLQDEVDYWVKIGWASSYQLMEKQLQQAIDNPQVKGILFYHDSPGGSAVGCKRIADLIHASRGKKPIHSYVQGLCASASFYIAAATEKVVATADSLIGSVGTIYTHQEYSKAYEEFGIKPTVFVNSESENKSARNSVEPLTAEKTKVIQEFVESYGTSFIDDVAKYRGIPRGQVLEQLQRGNVLRADVTAQRGMIEQTVSGFNEAVSVLFESSTPTGGVDAVLVSLANILPKGESAVDQKIKAQLFALGLISSIDASDDACQVVVNTWCKSQGKAVPSDEAEVLAILQSQSEASQKSPPAGNDGGSDDDGGDKGAAGSASNVQQAHETEQQEARLQDLKSAAEIINSTAGYNAVTSDMVLEALTAKQSAGDAMKTWNESLSEKEPGVPTSRIRISGEGRDRYAEDIVEALAYKALSDSQPDMEISDNAALLVGKPLWAVAGECLQLAGRDVDMYGNREELALQAMQMGTPGQRHTFYSGSENRQYVSASAGTPAARPGDFPNILSGLANKFLDTIQLDDDYSYPEVSAVLPGGLNDFKPGMMVNKGVVEELDELQNAEQFKELGLAEEVLSYIFLRRFGNRFGWTPVLVANDDMGAFVEGMIGLREAWQVTQNRLVLDQYTSNPSLLDGSSLFADRADVQTATNNNDRTSGAAPSDSEWGAMENLYADIGGIETGRRVRGTLNVALVPTGSVRQEAVRTFAPLNSSIIREGKQAATTANVGIYRGDVKIVPDSELRASSSTKWYGLRNPTRLNTATVVRAYFNGFGTQGRRERWYDPNDKTVWVSLEGRIAVAVKNWRYAIRNAGA